MRIDSPRAGRTLRLRSGQACEGARPHMFRYSSPVARVSLLAHGISHGTCRMALLTFDFEPKRSTVLAEFFGRSWINSFGQIQLLGIFLGAERSENALGREWRLVQTNSDCIVNCVRDRGDGCGQRTFAAFFGAKRAFRIDALNNHSFDLGRFR